MAVLRSYRRTGRTSGKVSNDRAFANSGRNEFDLLTTNRGLFLDGQKRIAQVSGVPLDKPTYVSRVQLAAAQVERDTIKEELDNSKKFDGVVKDVSTMDAARMTSFCERQSHRSNTFVNQFESKHDLAQENIVNRTIVSVMDAETQKTDQEAQQLKQRFANNVRNFQYA